MDTRTLESGMHSIQVIDGEADVRARFFTSLGRVDVEQQEVLCSIGPRSPGGVHVAGATVLVNLGLAKRKSNEVPVEAKRSINVAHSQLHFDEPSGHLHLLRL
jgi:hypothetical protein